MTPTSRCLTVGLTLLVAGAAPAGAETIEALGAKLRPHKAIYELQVHTIDPTSKVAEVNGAIYYEFGETCTAWTVRHKFRLAVVRASRPEVETLTDFNSTETKDGLSFRFSSTTKTDGQESERLVGAATLQSIGGPGEVVLTSPEAKRSALPAGTLFPTYHTLRLGQLAQEGKTQFWSTVFDGSDKAKHSGVNVVILGLVQPQIEPATVPPGRALTNAPGVRARVSYFDSDKADAKPGYELTLRLNSNGVTPEMMIDYGQFTLKAVLRAIEPLPRPKC